VAIRKIIGKRSALNGVMARHRAALRPEGFYGTFVGWRMNFSGCLPPWRHLQGGGYKLEDRARTLDRSLRAPQARRHLAQAQQEFGVIPAA